MTLQEFMAANNLTPKYGEEGDFSGFSGATDTNQYYTQLAQMMGYKGNNPGKFFLGMENADGSPIAKGSYSGTAAGTGTFDPNIWDKELRALTGSIPTSLTGGNAESPAAKWAMSQGGVNPMEYYGGQVKDPFDWIGTGLQAGAMAAMGGLATGMWGGGGSVFGGVPAATSSVSALPESYGSMVADAGGVMSDASVANVGTIGGAGTSAGTATGNALANAGNWGALDTLAGVVPGATYGAEAVAGGFGEFVSGLLGDIKTSDVAKAGANYLISSRLSDKAQQAGQQASQGANPLNQPQRQPYQQQLQQLLENPELFYSTNPVVKAQLDLARKQFQANSAKMGTGGTQFNDYLTNVQNIASGTFNDQAKLLSGLGGFTFGGGNDPNSAMQGALQSNRSLSSAFSGIGTNQIADKIFGNQTLSQFGDNFKGLLG